MTGFETLAPAVAALMRTVAAGTIMPRYLNLADDEVFEKESADDLVTIADREAEARLSDGLARLDPGTSIIGEEACAADPTLLERLATGRHWLIDPVDGTGNFAAGRTPFGVMIALVEDGAGVAGWMLDPTIDRMCHATRGGGAFLDEARVLARGTNAVRPVAALALSVVDPDVRRRAEAAFTLPETPRCAAEQYPRLVLGANDVALFHRTMPWDHAAGALWVEEAGGRVRRTDGARYHVGDGRTGLLGAASPALWDEAARTLFG